MHWDGTVSLGSMLEALVLVCGMAGVAIKLDRRLTKLEVKMNIRFGRFYTVPRTQNNSSTERKIEMKKLLLVFLLLAVAAQAGVLKMAAYPIRHSPVDT